MMDLWKSSAPSDDGSGDQRHETEHCYNFWEWTRDQCPAALCHATMPCGMRQSSAIPFLIKPLINMDCLGERDLFLFFPTTGYVQESPQDNE